jgi:hypothetical protein
MDCEAKEEAARQRKSRKRMTKQRSPSTWADWCQVAIQGVLLLGALRALSVYEGQLTEMREANKLMRESTDASAKAAKAAEDSVTLTKENSRLDQRGWVTVKGVGGVLEAGSWLIIAIECINTGKTVAMNTLVHFNISFVPDSDGRAPTEPIRATGIPASVSILAPNVPTTIRVGTGEDTRIITKEEIDALNSGTARFFVRGKIEYDDIFRCRHWTTFCARFNPISGKYEFCEERQNEVGDEPCAETAPSKK